MPESVLFPASLSPEALAEQVVAVGGKVGRLLVKQYKPQKGKPLSGFSNMLADSLNGHGPLWVVSRVSRTEPFGQRFDAPDRMNYQTLGAAVLVGEKGLVVVSETGVYPGLVSHWRMATPVDSVFLARTDGRQEDKGVTAYEREAFSSARLASDLELFIEASGLTGELQETVT